LKGGPGTKGKWAKQKKKKRGGHMSGEKLPEPGIKKVQAHNPLYRGGRKK